MPCFGGASRLLWIPVLLLISGCARGPQVATALTPTTHPNPTNPTGPIFRDVAHEVGVDFRHFSGATGGYFFPETAGSGVALFDYDNDGALDIFLVQGERLDPTKTDKDALVPLPPGWKPGCRLYHNLINKTGKLEFEDVTEKAGINHPGFGMGAAVGDYDNDGYPDLYVTYFGHNVLYHNNGNGTVTNVTASAGVDDPRWSSSAAFFDYDGDGYLDLIVVNYLDYTVKGDKPCYMASSRRDYCGPSAYHGVSARLFHNLGNGKFKDVSLESGIGSLPNSGLGVSCVDVNGDGKIDLIVSNDGARNHLWINKGGGKFVEEGLMAGIALDATGLPRANMGLAVGSFDNGRGEHVVVTHINGEGVAAYRNDGHGLFHDAVDELGFKASTAGFTGFGTEWIDYDNDGWLDLFIANGAITSVESQLGTPYPYKQTNQLFHNEGGSHFQDVSHEAGPALGVLNVGRGVAVGDLNNDGKLDVVVVDSNGMAQVLLNVDSDHHHWLEVKLVGVKCNRMALGAYVTALRKGESPIRRRCHTDGSYCSASDSRVHFGLGNNANLDGVVVEWPDGSKERFREVRVDSIVTLRQGSGTKEP